MEVVTVPSHTPKLIPEEPLEKMAEILKVLSHPVRFKIVNILMSGERFVGELVKKLGKEQSLTSQQLSILKLKGVLKSRRNGNVVYYSIKNSGVRNIIESIIENLDDIT